MSFVNKYEFVLLTYNNNIIIKMLILKTLLLLYAFISETIM